MGIPIQISTVRNTGLASASWFAGMARPPWFVESSHHNMSKTGSMTAPSFVGNREIRSHVSIS
jgi:hypothetical protein